MQDEKNVRPDFAKLPETAVFYQPEDRRNTREKLKDMNGKEKIAFIAEYYGINILVAAFLIGVVIFLILHFAFGKDIGLNILAVNTTQEDSPADQAEFYTEFLEKNGVDLSKEEVSVNSNFGVSAKAEDSISQTNLQTVQTRLMSGSVDVFFANEDVLYSIGEFEYLADLTDYLPSDVIEKYEEDLVYVKGLESGETYPVGIRISADNDWIRKSGWYPEGTVVGIQTNAEHGELATALVLEILGEE